MMRAALALSLTGLALVGQAPDGPYVWPLDLSRELTSSFAEYRPGRYHMGIDLRTGPVGKNVYAADAGEVVRIVCSPYGYGKAVYLRVRDGNTIVYAHLDEFMPPLSDYVRRAQHAQKSYTVSLSPGAGELPVERGQLIAKSGQTGIGVPHLHYEIRDKGEVPINPGLLGITWPDTAAPVFRKVAIVPLDPESTVNGDVLPVIRDLHRDADGKYRVDEISASGPIALAVDVYDPAAGGSKLGVYRIVMSVDDEELFRLSHDRLSYDHLNDGAAAYEPALRDLGQSLWLWRKPGNESEIYPQAGHDGRIEPVADSSKITVVAEDFAGNAVELVGSVRWEAPGPVDPPLPPPSGPVDTGRGRISFDYTGALFALSVRFDSAETVVPVLRVAGARPERVLMRRIGAREFRVAYRPAAPYADLHLNVEHPRVDADVGRFVFLQRSANALPGRIEFAGLHVDLSGAQPYGSIALHARPVPVTNAGPELVPVSSAVELWPPHVALDGNFGIGFPHDGDAASTRRLLVYRQTRDGWAPMARDDHTGPVGAKTSQLGVYAVMSDTVVPGIRVLEPRAGAPVTSRRPELKAEIADAGSGIDSFEATFNGEWLLMEYDPEQDLLRWERDQDLPAGPGRLVIEIIDRAGNVARRELELSVPD